METLSTVMTGTRIPVPDHLPDFEIPGPVGGASARRSADPARRPEAGYDLVEGGPGRFRSRPR